MLFRSADEVPEMKLAEDKFNRAKGNMADQSFRNARMRAEQAERSVRSMAYQMGAARFPAHRDLAGFEFSQASVDEALVRTLHGGASVVLAESVGSMAAYLCIDASKFYCVGLEVNANHLRGVRSGRVTAVARAVHIGRSTHVWEIRLHGDDGKPSCISRLMSDFTSFTYRCMRPSKSPAVRRL